MREILFKGKRTDCGEWVEGSLVMVCNGETLRRYPCIVISYNDDAFDWHEVIRDTIGQFTGLLDKNGKKIFEGDVCRGITVDEFGYNPQEWIETVKYDCPSFIMGKYFTICSFVSIEVIGNIADNIECLKQ